MQVLFKAIRARDVNKVISYIQQEQGLANCIAKSPPKCDDGQSPLQVAFKTDDIAIARLLIEYGADINFIDSGKLNTWHTPVFHDFIR